MPGKGKEAKEEVQIADLLEPEEQMLKLARSKHYTTASLCCVAFW